MNNEVSAAVKTENTEMIKNGEMNLAGMQIKISDIIGDKLVDQFIASISPEQMEEVTHAFFKEVFEEVTREEFDASSNKYKTIKSYGFKKKGESGSWGHRSDTPVYERAKATIRGTYTVMIEQKIIDYMQSQEFKDKAEVIAKEISDYALEGYKEDVIKGVRSRMVEPVLYPYTPDINIRNIIQEELHKATMDYDNRY